MGPPSPTRSVRSRALRRHAGAKRPEDAAPYLSVLSDLVLVIVQRSPRLECGFRLRIKLAGGSAAIEAEGREPGLDLAHHVRVQREDVFRILAVQQGHIVDIEYPDQLLDRFGMIVDPDVDPAVIETAVATTLADHQECRGLLPSLVAARTLSGAEGPEKSDRKISLRPFERFAHLLHDVFAREEVSLAGVIPADEMAGPWEAFPPGVRGRPAARVHDAGLPLRGFLVGLHETLQRILRCDTLLQQGEGLRAVRRVRVRLGRDGADPGPGEGHNGSDGDELRFDRDAEVLRLWIEPDDAKGRRPGPWHGSGHRLAGY